MNKFAYFNVDTNPANGPENIFYIDPPREVLNSVDLVNTLHCVWETSGDFMSNSVRSNLAIADKLSINIDSHIDYTAFGHDVLDILHTQYCPMLKHIGIKVKPRTGRIARAKTLSLDWLVSFLSKCGKLKHRLTIELDRRVFSGNYLVSDNVELGNIKKICLVGFGFHSGKEQCAPFDKLFSLKALARSYVTDIQISNSGFTNQVEHVSSPQDIVSLASMIVWHTRNAHNMQSVCDVSIRYPNYEHQLRVNRWLIKTFNTIRTTLFLVRKYSDEWRKNVNKDVFAYILSYLSPRDWYCKNKAKDTPAWAIKHPRWAVDICNNYTSKVNAMYAIKTAKLNIAQLDGKKIRSIIKMANLKKFLDVEYGESYEFNISLLANQRTQEIVFEDLFERAQKKIRFK